eukprot:5690435-Prymnesium_polylepis.1
MRSRDGRRVDERAGAVRPSLLWAGGGAAGGAPPARRARVCAVRVSGERRRRRRRASRGDAGTEHTRRRPRAD